MTPKQQKARELTNKFRPLFPEIDKISWEKRKQCAIICVGEIMNYLEPLRGLITTDFLKDVQTELENI